MTENIIVANLKCGGCVYSIKNKLNELRGIDSINVDWDTHTITIIYQGIENHNTHNSPIKGDWLHRSNRRKWFNTST